MKDYYQKIDAGTFETLEELKAKVAGGNKLIAYSYVYSILFALSIRGFSPAFTDDDELKLRRMRTKYNLISLFFGIWTIPWGLFRTIKAIKSNNRGEINVTDDIMINIDQDSFAARRVRIQKTNQLFAYPDKWDTRSLQKAFEESFEFDYNLRRVVIAMFINVGDDEYPHKVIGLLVQQGYNDYPDKCLTAFKKYYRKNSDFEFVDLSEKSQQNDLLCQQGMTILLRN